MRWLGLPPGSILQYMYIQRRIRKISRYIANTTFIEIGAGNGYVSNIFLRNGFEGIGVNLNPLACENNRALNQKYVLSSKDCVINGDFLDLPISGSFGIIAACMLIEHLHEEKLALIMSKVSSMLARDGIFMILVPANMKFWSIEDEIAGHVKRYDLHDLWALATSYGLVVTHSAALTYPLSNWLLPLSSYLVRKHEGHLINLSNKARTIHSGNRNVPLKTKVPFPLSILVNPISLYPFYILQHLFRRKYNKCLVLYAELSKKTSVI